MKLVIQRVKGATLSVEGEIVSEIEKGLCVYFGVEKNDKIEDGQYFAKKTSNMRIFEDENGKMNLSVLDIKGEILLISQFTLCADCRRGNRPDFMTAEEPQKAKEVYIAFADLLRAYGVPVKMGIFGADMKIAQLNDGPVTIIL